jgi:hypothetical protein
MILFIIIHIDVINTVHIDFMWINVWFILFVALRVSHVIEYDRSNGKVPLGHKERKLW